MVKEGTGEPKAETNIILLDCCRTNPFAWTGRGGQEGLAPESPLRNCIISFAAEPGKSAVDGQGKDSPYSQALAQHILVKGLDIQNMLTRVAKDVSIETQQRQYPESWSGLSSPFFFVEDQGQGALTHTMPNTTPKAETEEPTSVGSPRRFSDPIDLVRQILAESSDNEPNAFVPYLQFPMDSYHGQKHADASYIAADRERYIKRWPSREFQLISGPTMTHHASDGDYEVVTRSTYTVNNPHLGKTRSGVTIMTWRVHPLADGGFKISSIEEQAEKNGVTAKHRARSR
jgi:phytoene dehydrogenase-like protein